MLHVEVKLLTWYNFQHINNSYFQDDFLVRRFLWSNWPIMKENNDRLPLAICINLKAVFQAKISQFPTLCITD